MKRIFVLAMMALCLSCSAQKVAPDPVSHGQLTVITIAGEQITFKSSQGSLFIADGDKNALKLPSNLNLEEGRIFYVTFKILDCDQCFKRKISILGYTLDVIQVQKDKSELLKTAPHITPGA